jgi:hypothetical protein
MLLAWGTSVWIGAWDRRSLARWIVRFSALGYGLVWLLVGIQFAVSTGATVVFQGSAAWQTALNDELPFVGVLVTGALIVLPYFVWIQRAEVVTASAKQARAQGVFGLPAALSLAFLLIGGSLTLSWAVEQMVPVGHLANTNDWAQAIGFLVAGGAWLPLWLVFKRHSDPTREGPTLPRRGYVLAVLGYTGIATVAAAVFAIYQVVEAALGLFTADHLVARQAATAAVVVGAAALYHGLRLRADLGLLHARQPAPVRAPLASAPSASAETLEEILQAAVAGKIGIELAAARIRDLYAMQQPEKGTGPEHVEHQLVAR